MGEAGDVVKKSTCCIWDYMRPINKRLTLHQLLDTAVHAMCFMKRVGIFIAVLKYFSTVVFQF